MKPILEYIISKSTKRYIIKATDINIKEIVQKEIDRLGPNANLNHIDVSEVTDMHKLFESSNFNGDISQWNVRNLKNAYCMFHSCKNINCDFSNWNLEKIERAANMFFRCSKLTTTPILSNMNLKYEIYYGMFADCTSLKETPEFPALDLENSCYIHMFNNCTNLEIAHDLPAKKLQHGCYKYMFYNCYNLKKLPKMAATQNDQENPIYTQHMF